MQGRSALRHVAGVERGDLAAKHLVRPGVGDDVVHGEQQHVLVVFEPQELVEKLLEIVKGRLIAGEDVMVSGFGKWSVKGKRARRGRNPQTGELLILDARRVVTWKYSPRLKKACNP